MNSHDGNEGNLKRTLGTLDIFSIATGAMVSSGLFVLPALIYGKVGPGIILAYLLASLFIIPSLFAKAELTSAMPKSGGDYFFITRSFGPLFGIFSGLAAWFSLSLKSAFALLGIGIFLEPFLSGLSPNIVKLVAVACTLIFTILNLLSVKETGRMQIIFVFILLAILLFYIVSGINRVQLGSFTPFMTGSWKDIFAVTGLVFVSFGGLTKVAAVAEEVKSPGKTVPRGMFTAFFVVSLLYLFVIFITVGVLNRGEIASSMTPIAYTASKLTGNIGFILLSAAAMLAFITTGNAGILASSRTPMAMSRDQLIPPFFGKVGRKTRTPYVSILMTALFMIVCILFLDLENLVKVASTMKLLLFLFNLLSVVVLRSSKLVSYKPSYKMPLYPVLPILGIGIYLFLITEMGRVPLLITGGFFILALVWYLAYARRFTRKKSAFLHMVGNITNRELVRDRNVLEDELLDILRERDEIEEDRFDKVIRNSAVLDLDRTMKRQEFFEEASRVIEERWGIPREKTERKLNEREAQTSTLLYPGVAVPHAIPHIIVEGQQIFDILLVRNKYGIEWNDEGDVVYTAFCMLGSKDERNFHLKSLMYIAQILQDPDFHQAWMHARSPEELRSVILVSKRRRG